ncbi:hypothetical protein Sjap_005156 [Stephania japonica]|uniref:Nucleoporin autopeptidase n=1 Tax=Stephania japonica TaxID=461633 RepID=A0AAP0PHL9_9MAGN
MFASTNPFGQSSSSSPFGSPSVFGQTNNAASNPFAPKPFGGGAAPFGAQTGGSIFGAATGVFGATQSSAPMASTPTFGASPAMGNSMPAFGASTTPAFGSGNSLFFTYLNLDCPYDFRYYVLRFRINCIWAKTCIWRLWNNTYSSKSVWQYISANAQSAFGSNIFGLSAPFGSSSQPTFGATSAPAFGVTSTPTFGATSTPAFGSSATPAFGSTTTGFGGSSMPAFGSGGAFGASSTPAFGASTTAFGSSTPVFGGSSMPAFGTSNTTAFGAPSSPAFGGSSNTPAFGASSNPAFGASSTSSFSFGSSAAFGQSSAAFGSSPFAASSSSFGGQSTPFGTQSTTPAFGSTVFGQSTFGAQRGGSRIAAYTPVPEADGGSGTQPAGKLESISAMPVYKEKSHEELRWEDYQLGDKGGPNPAAQPTSAAGFGSPASQSNPFGSPAFGQSSSSLFSASSSNPFNSKTTAFGSSSFGAPTTPAFGSSAFGASTTNLFPTASSSTSFSTPAFGATPSPSLFGSSSSPAFGSSPSIFSTSTPGPSTSAFGSGLNFGNTQSAGLFQSTTPSLGQTTATFGQGTTPSFGQSGLFSTPSTGFGGNLFSNTSASSLSATNIAGFGQTTSAQPSQPSGAFAFGNFGQTQATPASSFGGVPSPLGQAPFGQPSASYNPMVMQAPTVMNPFGTLPAMPQMSVGRTGSTPSVQYGISSMPVTEKPTPVRVSSLLMSRHISQRRIRLPARKYHPKVDGSKVPFFSDDEETPSAPKADALVIPRENPRALVIHPTEKWPSAANSNKSTMLKDTSTLVDENGTPADSNSNKDKNSLVQPSLKPNGMHEDHTTMQKGDSYITLTGHRAGEAAIVYEHGADVEALMPKLRHSDYYTEPRIQELAAKERAEPGFCSHVRDFVVGRHGYGSIRFVGETDVRRLDLESLIQFNNREVIVYMDENKKPPVGQGLNKPAEVTLLNIKCFDKKTGQQYTEGSKVEKYKEMLKKKAQEQGAEFVSYDPIKGEWKFRVSHFSRYELKDVDLGEEVEIETQDVL